MTDRYLKELTVGDFFVYASNCGMPSFGRVLKINKERFQAVILYPDNVIHRALFKIWNDTNHGPAAWQAVRVEPQGIPKYAMDVLDKVK